MNDLDKLDLIGGIDPKYVDGAAKAPQTSRRNLRKIIIPAAACLCLVAVGLIIHGANAGKQLQVAENLNTQTATETPGITAGGESQANSSEENSQTIVFNGAEVPGDNSENTVYNGAQVPDEDTDKPVFNGAQVPDEDSDKPVFNGAQVPGDDPDNTPSGTVVYWVSSYGDPSYDEDLTVENGTVVLSESLKKAISEYGSEDNIQMPGDATPHKAVYRVEVIFFKDGKKLPNDSQEATGEEKRFIINGYTVATEELQQDGVTEQLFWTLHATAKQLLDLEPQPDLGYYIVLFDEYTGIESDQYAVFNGADASD